MENASIRCMINNEFIVINLFVFYTQYKGINLKAIIKSKEDSVSLLTDIELGDFDLQGKMNYQKVDLLNLKLTFLDEKSIQITNKDTFSYIRNIFENAIIFSEYKPNQEDEDWFGEKLFYGKYPKMAFHLKSNKIEWISPSTLKEFLIDIPKLNNFMVSTGGYQFDNCNSSAILDLSRTHENHLFVEDEEHLLLGTGLSPATSIYFRRSSLLSETILIALGYLLFPSNRGKIN